MRNLIRIQKKCEWCGKEFTAYKCSMQEQILVHQEELNRLVSYASNKIYLRQIRYCYNNHGRTNQITSSLRMSA